VAGAVNGRWPKQKQENLTIRFFLDVTEECNNKDHPFENFTSCVACNLMIGHILESRHGMDKYKNWTVDARHC
jgi:hypothetical protein